MATTNLRRWVLVNRNTSKMTRSFKTRDAARIAKGPNHIIFDTVKSAIVR
jgi:hypothetical protein